MNQTRPEPTPTSTPTPMSAEVIPPAPVPTASTPEDLRPVAVTPDRQRHNPLYRLYLWVLSWANTPYGTPALAGISFVESSFFPIPPDVLQIALSFAKPSRAFYYAFVSCLASVAGAVLGWAIGYYAWENLQSFFFNYVPGFTPENYTLVQNKYQENAVLAIALAAITPLPYKVFTIAAGVCQVSPWILVIVSLPARGLRFFTIAALIYFFGESMKWFLEKYFNWLMILFGILLVGGFIAIKFLASNAH